MISGLHQYSTQALIEELEKREGDLLIILSDKFKSIVEQSIDHYISSRFVDIEEE